MPQLPTPAATGDVWGNQLNGFLNQLQSGTDGSINYSTSRPTKTASDAGYTMVDTSTREIIRWTGTAWEVLMGGIDKGRPRLTGNANIYLDDTNGNDTNNGATAATAFKTINRAVAAVYALDLGNFNITINIAAGTYLGIFDFSAPVLGANGSSITIKGAGSGSTILQTSNLFNQVGVITNSGSNRVRVTGVRLQATGTTGLFLRGLFQFGPGIIYIDTDVNFGNFNIGTNSQHIYCETGRIQIDKAYTISGGARIHYNVGPAGLIATSGITTPFTSTFTNNPNFTIFASSDFGFINTDACLFSGAATVSSFKSSANVNGVIINVSGWPAGPNNAVNGGVVV